MHGNDETFFPDKRPNEQVVHVIRRHGLVMVKHVFLLLMLWFIPIALFVFFALALEVDFFNPGIPQILAVFVGSLVYLYAWLAFFHNWVDYYLDIWIVTNERLLNIEQEGLFSRVISETNISKVQDVTSEVHGKLQTFLDFGEVHVQSAGEEKRFVFEEVPHPREIAQEIIRLHDASAANNGVSVAPSVTMIPE